MDILDFIYSRRSIRKYKKEEIKDEIITELLKAAMAAPSAAGKDPWRYIVIKNKSTLKTIAEGLPNGNFIENAPLGIIICGDINCAHANELSYLLQDCAAAIENLLLAANILQLGCCWIGVHPRKDRISFIQNLFNLPDNIIPVSCISVGYPDERKEPRTRFNKDYVHIEKW
jgi:nitroreductase